MKTTIYDLLGMIKDDKFVKRILFRNQVYEYDEDGKDYYNEEYGWVFDEYDLISILNEPIEILETTTTYTPPSKWATFIKEDEKWKPIKILPLITERVGERTEQVYSCKNKFRWLIQDIRGMSDKINEIIEVLNERQN